MDGKPNCEGASPLPCVGLWTASMDSMPVESMEGFHGRWNPCMELMPTPLLPAFGADLPVPPVLARPPVCTLAGGVPLPKVIKASQDDQITMRAGVITLGRIWAFRRRKPVCRNKLLSGPKTIIRLRRWPR